MLSSLVVLLWPMAAYACIFLFDAPGGTPYFELKRYALVIGLLTYPWAYLVGIARILARRKGQAWWSKLTIAFLLAPFAQLALLYLIALALGR